METPQTEITSPETSGEPIVTPKPPKKTRGWLNVLKIILPYFLIVGLFQYAGMMIAGVNIAHYRDIHPTDLQLFITYLFSMAGTLGVVWLFTRFVDRIPFTALGFQTVKPGRDLIYGILLGIVLMAAGFVLLLGVGELNITGFHFQLSGFLLNLGLFICVAITEEVFARGYILGNLMASMNKYLALVISAVLFSLMHAANNNVTFLALANIFMAGILLGMPYIFNRRLWFPIALHLSWNFMQGPVFGYEVSGTQTTSLFTTTYPHGSIWNGGTFGFEGSLPSLVLLIVASAGLYFYYRRRGEMR